MVFIALQISSLRLSIAYTMSDNWVQLMPCKFGLGVVFSRKAHTNKNQRLDTLQGSKVVVLDSLGLNLTWP